MTPFISICIPAYKRIDYLKRLLESILIQSYTNFEVVITDDTPGDEVMQFCVTYSSKLPLHYFKNKESLGTPENWNESVRKATGQWIKLMHDDDWFFDKDSLQQFAAAIVSNPESSFIFSAYNFIYEQDNNRKREMRLSKLKQKRLARNQLYLVRENLPGNPSCTLYKKDDSITFDSRLKWVVDFEFEIRYLNSNGNKFVYIDKTLINLSVNTSQVTNSVFGVSSIWIPENQIMLAKLGFTKLKNLYVYDHFWRLYRNMDIKRQSQIVGNGYSEPLHPVLISMINWQRFFSLKLFRKGVFSKALMFLHYCTHFYQLK